MKIKQKLKLVVLTLFLAGLFTSAVWLLREAFIKSWNDTRLEELTEQALSRTELALDVAIRKLDEIAALTGSSCDPMHRAALTRILYSTSLMKDIRLNMQDRVCWALDKRLEGIDEAVATPASINQIDAKHSIFSIRLSGFLGLGLRRQQPGRGDIVEVISTNGLLFDSLPAGLRDGAMLSLALDDGNIFSISTQENLHFTDARWRTFKKKSDRYPINLTLNVDPAVLKNWNRELLLGRVAIVALIGLGFGALAARGMIRDPTILDELDTALSNGEIQPYYQPIFDLETREMKGFEMLARWIKPDGTMISPMNFIPLAESSGRIERLTGELMKQAGQQVGDLLRRKPELKLTFNVTPDQYLSIGFVEKLTADMIRFGLPAHSLVVEVTERQAISDRDRAAFVTAQLIDAGMRIAIDDVGTGHSGLSSIHALGANYLKLDKMFVDGITLDRKSTSLVELLTSFAREFGMTVIAEGIESEEQIAALLALGIREGQGFVYSRPVPAGEIIRRASASDIAPDAASRLKIA